MDGEEPLISQFWVRTAQFAIAAAVTMGCIYFQETTGYKINPYIIGAWSFMAAYGATLLAVRLSDRRIRYGRILPRFRRDKASHKSL